MKPEKIVLCRSGTVGLEYNLFKSLKVRMKPDENKKTTKKSRRSNTCSWCKGMGYFVGTARSDYDTQDCKKCGGTGIILKSTRQK